MGLAFDSGPLYGPVLPILISLSVTPGPYCFAARAGRMVSSGPPKASAAGAAARIVRRVRCFTVTFPAKYATGLRPGRYRLRHRDTYANANLVKPAAPDGITKITSSMMTP